MRNKGITMGLSALLLSGCFPSNSQDLEVYGFNVGKTKVDELKAAFIDVKCETHQEIKKYTECWVFEAHSIQFTPTAVFWINQKGVVESVRLWISSQGEKARSAWTQGLTERYGEPVSIQEGFNKLRWLGKNGKVSVYTGNDGSVFLEAQTEDAAKESAAWLERMKQAKELQEKGAKI